jgi:SpoVK/Ycf46/Vps4 family AAA+-type ATPase
MEGIMIATTNLTENLDPAFERRFLYKIEFTIPEVSTRAKIWKSMMPFLSDQAALYLAGKFPFSGGQIENISRKSVVEYILSGRNMTLKKITELCEMESYTKERRRLIGF